MGSILHLLSPLVREIIKTNIDKDPHQLLLKLSKKKELPYEEIINQIIGFKKAKIKLSTWSKNNKLIYPPVISMEQCSSEATAKYKSDLFNGNVLIDLTGGFGVDSYYLSKSFTKAFYVEPNSYLFTIVNHNFKELGVDNVVFENKTAEEFIANINEKADCIYIDPSRRGHGNNKVFFLSDCVPDILNLKSRLFEIAESIVIKTSPMLDIDKAIQDLGVVEKVIVVSLYDECKEVLYVLKRDFINEPLIESVNINKGKIDKFNFYKTAEKVLSVSFSKPLSFLYDPNSAVLKSGAFKSLAKEFNLIKIAASSHLYTSTNLVENFPGNVFRVIGTSKYNPNEIKKIFKSDSAIILLRNFPYKIKDILKKLKVKEGGKEYLICTSLEDKTLEIILCEKIIS